MFVYFYSGAETGDAKGCGDVPGIYDRVVWIETVEGIETVEFVYRFGLDSDCGLVFGSLF